MVHHLLPQIPHYNLEEATAAVKPVMGPYYRCSALHESRQQLFPQKRGFC